MTLQEDRKNNFNNLFQPPWKSQMLKTADFAYYSDLSCRAGDKTRARISYIRAIKERPDEGYINFKFARFLADQKKYDEAEFRYKKASIMMPEMISVYNEWGLMLDRQGKLEGQEELFRKTIELEPGFVEGLCNLGAVLTEKGRFEEARALFERALEKRPANPNCNNNLGSLYLILGKYDDAVEKFQKTIELSQSYYLPFLNLSLVYGCMGKDTEANESYQKGREFIEKCPGKKEWILREYKRLLGSARENLLKEENENDDEKRNHNERFSKALEDIVFLLEC